MSLNASTYIYLPSYVPHVEHCPTLYQGRHVAQTRRRTLRRRGPSATRLLACSPTRGVQDTYVRTTGERRRRSRVVEDRRRRRANGPPPPRHRVAASRRGTGRPPACSPSVQHGRTDGRETTARRPVPSPTDRPTDRSRGAERFPWTDQRNVDGDRRRRAVASRPSLGTSCCDLSTTSTPPSLRPARAASTTRTFIPMLS